MNVKAWLVLNSRSEMDAVVERLKQIGYTDITDINTLDWDLEIHTSISVSKEDFESTLEGVEGVRTAHVVEE